MTDPTIFDQVYNDIKKKILHLEYKPGRPLSIASVADSLGVSRTPVHEALNKLSTENFVDMFPKSGSRVSLIDIKKTADERFLRKALEKSALVDMFYNLDESYLPIMENCIEEQSRAFNENRYADSIDWDDMFHRQIFKCVDREYCYHIVHKYNANEYRVRLLAEKAIVTTKDAVLQNHKDIIRFLRDRDLASLMQVEEQHLSRISNEITSLMAAFPDLFISGKTAEAPAKIRCQKGYDENYLETVERIVSFDM